MTSRLRVSRRAGQQIRVASAWWLQNREKAPLAFADDLEDALLLIADLPSVGEPVAHPAIPGIRRLLLTRTRYHLYYVENSDTQSVEVLALWHVSRKSQPKL